MISPLRSVECRPHPLADQFPTELVATFDFDGVAEDEEALFWVPIEEIKRVIDPLKRPRWNGVPDPISRSEVLSAAAAGRIQTDHVGAGEFIHQATKGISIEDAMMRERTRHIERIATFVIEMPDDPITIDVGMPELGYSHGVAFVVEDGHHRIAAGIVRGDDLLVSFCGSCDTFRALFPMARGFRRPIQNIAFAAAMP